MSAPLSSALEPETILAGLNPAQQEAVRTTEGPVLIIAGPGSGKTRTLTHRVAYLLASGRAHAHEILALTFTNKAAREMQERISHLVGAGVARRLWMGTFHSIFARILRREADRLGYTSDFSIYDQEDSERVIKNLLQQHGIDTSRISPRAIRARISGAKNQLVSPQEYTRVASEYVEQVAARIYAAYQEHLRKSNAMDFDDLLLMPIRLFEQYPEVLTRYQERWKYVHIDEYQDTNRAQYMIARMLSGRHKNLCVVGDDAQSIYAFRGADIRNILDFKRDFPEARIIRLEQNYRSTRRILQLADSIIRHNREQLEKTLWTENPEGDYVRLIEAISERDEAQKVERLIRNLRAQAGYGYRDFAILYRTNAQSRSLEEALRRGGVPYRLVGGLSFYRRKEIKDVLAYLRLLVNPHDEESLRRVINYPTRGIGLRTLEQLSTYARTHGFSLWQAIERVDEVGLSARAMRAVQDFHFLIARHASKMTEMPLDELAASLIREAGVVQTLREEHTPESMARLENIQELLNAMAEFVEQRGEEEASLSAFLQEIALYTDLDTMEDEDNRVTLMTLHASKGLEFPVVFITGLEENLFPLQAATRDPVELEEERRLLYVGITRAKERLYLSYARTRYRFGKQEPMLRSRFLEELDTSVIRSETGQPPRRRSRGYGRPVSPSSVSPPKPPAERHVVYEEGYGEIMPGMHVVHEQFGQGKVLAVEGRGDRARATVYFKGVGQKKLVLKFARLKVVEV